MELRPYLLEFGGHFRGVVLRRFPQLARFLLDIRAVLVGAHEEVRVESGKSLVAGETVRPDLLVGGAEMRAGVDVIDRRRDIERFHVGLPRYRIVFARPVGVMEGLLPTFSGASEDRLRGSVADYPARTR